MKRSFKAASVLTAALLLSMPASVTADAESSDYHSQSSISFNYPYDKADLSLWQYKVLDSLDGVYDKPCIELTHCSSTDKTIVVPSEIEGLPVVSLGQGVFSSDPYLEESTIYFPDSLQHFDKNFMPDENSILIYTESGDKYLCYSYFNENTGADPKHLRLLQCGNRKNIVIPEAIGNLPVSETGIYLLQYAKDAESLELPDTITYFDEYLLGESTSLKKLKLPAHINILPSHTMNDAPSLEEVIFPDDIKFIPADALPDDPLFDYPKEKVVDNLSEVYVSDTEVYTFDPETEWCYKLFANNSKVEVTLVYAPDLQGPPPSEYMGYPLNIELYPTPPYGIPVITIPEGTEDLSGLDFFEPQKIRQIIVKSKHLYIFPQAFAHSVITDLNFPGTIKIGGSAFQFCNKLQRVNFNGTDPIIHIEFGAFWYDEALRDLLFPDSVAFLTIENDAFYKSGIEKLDLPDGDITIGDSAFAYCNALKSISISDKTTIDKKAFDSCTALTDATFRGQTKIANKAFIDCTSLTNINIDLSTPINGGAFTNCTDLTSINGKPVFDSNGNADKDLLRYIEENFSNADDNGIINGYVNYIVKKTVAETITDDMTDVQKVKALHDKLCSLVVFDDSVPLAQENHVDASVFLNDTSVCDGYARAMNLLLHEAGFESCYVNNPDHAWVIANIGGHYFHVDPTWDDLDVTIYDWFMRSDDQIRINSDHMEWEIRTPSSLHSFQKGETPKCTDHMGDVNNDMIVDARDASDILTGYAMMSVGDDSDLDPVLADYDFNGHIDAIDASKVLTDYAKSSADNNS